MDSKNGESSDRLYKNRSIGPVNWVSLNTTGPFKNHSGKLPSLQS